MHTGDKSRKGSVDAPIAALVHDINTRDDMYTTSSCSGRISIFGEAGEAERVAGKKGGEWLLASHDTVTEEEVLCALREGVERSGMGRVVLLYLAETALCMECASCCLRFGHASARYIQCCIYVYTPCCMYMHNALCCMRVALQEQPLSCATKPSSLQPSAPVWRQPPGWSTPHGTQLVNATSTHPHAHLYHHGHTCMAAHVWHLGTVAGIATIDNRAAGFRESGVTLGSRIIVGLRCSLRLEAPLAAAGRVLVSDEYIGMLVDLCNTKQRANWQRIARLHAMLKAGVSAASTLLESSSSHNNAAAVCMQRAVESTVLVRKRKPLKKSKSPSNGDQPSMGLQGPVEGGVCALQWAPLLPADTAWVGPQGGAVAWLRRWGHTVCAWGPSRLVVCGGYGGLGAHSRLGDVVVVDVGHTRAMRLLGQPGTH